MNAPEPQRHILITRTSRRPRATDVRRFMTRFFDGDVPDAAVDQLIGALTVANRWLVDHPEDAARLIEDPASVLEAMKTSGALAHPVDELLAALRSQRRDAEGKLTVRARLVNFLRPTSARFGRKPVHRFSRIEAERDELNEREDR